MEVTCPAVPLGACAIPITGGSRWAPIVRAWAFVSAEDYDEIAQYRWGMTSGGYARRALPRAGQRPKFIYMHRVILRGVAEVDHVNRNPLDNRRENLRPATRSTNIMNSRRMGESGYHGVTPDKRRGTWVARVTKDGVTVRRSGFVTPDDAAMWRDAVAREVHGEFFTPARLPIPPSD